MSAYRSQTYLDAPLSDVWALVGNPAIYPDWWPVAVEIGGQTFKVGDAYTQVVGIGGRQLDTAGSSTDATPTAKARRSVSR